MKKIFAYGIAVITLLVLIVYNTTVSAYYFLDNGYVFPDDKIESILSSKDAKDSKGFNLIKTKENEEYTEKHGTYYDKDKNKIDIDYPMIIKNNTALRFLKDGSYLINDAFNFVPLQEKSIVSDQTCFDNDGRVVDKDSYMMVQLNNSIFISTTDITITTKLKTYTFSKFSLFSFGEDYVNVYRNEKGHYSLITVRGLTGATIQCNDMNMTYEEFYKKLLNVQDRIEAEKKQVEEKADEAKKKIKKEKEKKEAEPATTGNPDKAVESDAATAPAAAEEAPAKDEPTNPEPGPVNPSQDEYVKPEVSVSDVTAWVWTINGQMKINDPSGRIQGGVIYYVYDESGKLVLRQNIKGSGLFDIGVLKPNTYYAVYARFEYRNKQNQLISEDVLPMTALHTKAIDGNVEPVKLTYEDNDYTLPKTMMLKNVKLDNTSDYDSKVDTYANFIKNTLPYISKIQFTFTDEDGKEFTCNLPNTALSSLKKGETVDSVETAKILSALTKYDYTIKCYDKYSNEIPMNPSIKGSYRTSKAEPAVSIKLKSSNPKKTVLQLELTDDDNALIGENYYLQIYNGDELVRCKYSYSTIQQTTSKFNVSKGTKTVELTLEDLPYASSLTIYARGKYNLENGQGERENQDIGKLNFFSGNLPDGSIVYNNNFQNVGGTFADMTLSIRQNSTTDLVSLLTDFTYTVKSDDQEITQKLSKEQFDQINVDKNYDDENQYLVIQEGTLERPRIVLKASKEAIQSQGAWQTFLNSGIIGPSNSLSGTLEFNFIRYTLTQKTTYQYSMTSNIHINDKDNDIQTSVMDEEFTTLGGEPIITLEDYFLAENFIELYNITSSDESSTIINQSFVLQLLEDGELINSKKLKVGETYDTIRFNNLSAGHKYTLQFVAPQFNQGNDESTLETNRVLQTYEFDSVEGVKGNIELDDVRYSYGNSFLSSAFVSQMGDGVTVGQTFNTTTHQMEDNENYFVTDYIPFDQNKYSFFQDFGGYEKMFYIVAYKEDKTYYTYTNPTRAAAETFDQYRYNGWRTNTNIKYIRIVGYKGYEDKARFYQLDTNQFETLANVQEKPDQFIDGVAPGSDTLDYADLSKSTTGEIEVTPGESLFMQSNRTRYLYFYDKDHKYITSRGGGAGDYGVVEVPAQAKYVRYSIYSLDKSAGDVAILYRIKDSSTNGYVGTMKHQLTDNANDFFVLSKVSDDQQYYIRRSSSTNLKDPSYNVDYDHTFDMDPDKNGAIAIDKQSEENLKASTAYKYELYVKYKGREIVLSTYTFQTNNKVYLLKTADDLKYIQYDSYATFLVSNDIVEGENYAPVNGHFGGTFNLQGHTLTLNYSSGNYFIYYLTPKGTIENGTIKYNCSIDRGLVCNNYGTIKNIVYDVDLPIEEDSSQGISNTVKQSLVYTNQKTGKITNFVVKFNGDTMIYYNKSSRYNTVLTKNNHGIIKDGYVYNTAKDGKVYIPNPPNSSYAYNGVIAGYCSETSRISDVYSTINLYCDYNSVRSDNGSTGIFAGYSSGRITNSFGVSNRYVMSYQYDIDKRIVNIKEEGLSSFDDPLVGYKSGTSTDAKGDDTGLEFRYANVYLLSDNSALLSESNSQYVYSKTFDLSNLYDSKWYESHIQSNKQFDVDTYVTQGYYPMVLSTDGQLLENQTYNPLPEMPTIDRPELLESVIDKETTNYVDVYLKFNNPSLANINGVTVDNIGSVQVLEQYVENDVYYVKVRLSNPSIYVTGYNLTSYTYRGTLSNITVNKTLPINASFYRLISTVDEWKQARTEIINGARNNNYRLGNDIDFSKVSATDFLNSCRISGTYSGNFDGGRYNSNGEMTGRYTIRGINLSSSTNTNYYGIVFENISKGTLKNVNFEDIEWNRTSSAGPDVRGSIISQANYETIDNVHVRNIKMTSKNYTAPLIGYATNGTLSNCTGNNITLKTNEHNNNTFVGGLIAYVNNFDIHNCYVAGLNIQTGDVDLSYSVGVGGIVGFAGNTKIDDCYAVGKIKSTSYCGGIAGTGNAVINTCYSDVFIETEGDYNGGIYGTADTSGSVNNSLSVGSFVNSITKANYTNPIIAATSYWWLNNNYGYEYQKYNDDLYTKLQSADATGFATVDQLKNETYYRDTLQLGDSYTYDRVSNGILPYLKSTNGDLLPYQSDDYIITGELKIEVGQAIAQTVSDVNSGQSHVEYDTILNIAHSGYEVEKVQIDGMNNLSGFPQCTYHSDETDRYEIKSTKAKAFDTYKARATVKSLTTGETQEITCSVNYGSSEYWVIHDASEWQQVMSDHGRTKENIMISGTVDLSKVSNPITDVVVNSIVGDPINSSNTIKNVTISNGDSNVFINTVFTEIKDLQFENIHIVASDTTSLKNVNGVIGVNQGKATNLKFKNCSIKGPNNGYAYTTTNSYIGMICKNGGPINNVDIEDITVKVKSVNNMTNKASTLRDVYTSAGIAYATSEIKNVTGKEIYVDAPYCSSVGGLVGYAQKKDTNTVYVGNLKLSAPSDGTKYNEIYGSRYVGGVIGRVNALSVYDSQTEKVTVGVKEGSESDYYNPTDTSTEDGGYVGGLIGYTDALVSNDSLVDNSVNAKDVIARGDHTVGGVVGRAVNINYQRAENVTVDSIAKSGGICGISDGTINYCRVKDSTIRAKTTSGDNGGVVAGGISGYSYNISNSYTLNSNVTANQYAGGICGIAGSYDRSTFAPTYRQSYIRDNGVNKTTVEATTSHAGGITGLSYTNNSTDNYRNFVKDRSTITAPTLVGGLIGEMKSGIWRSSYVDDITVTATGDYAGGLVGKADIESDNDYVGSLHQSYSHATVSGNDYVGGIYGYYNVTIHNTTANHYLYSLMNMSDITGSGSHVYAVGYNEDGALSKVTSGYYGALTSYDQVKLKGSTINKNDKSQLSNDTNDKFYYVDQENVTDYTLVNKNVSDGGLNMNISNFNYYMPTAVKLENFTVSYLGNTSYSNADGRYQFALSGIDLKDGKYYIKPIALNESNVRSVTNATGNMIYVKDGVAYVDEAYTNNVLEVQYGTSNNVNRHWTFTIADVDNQTDYRKATIYSCNPGYNLAPLVCSNNDAKKATYKDRSGNIQATSTYLKVEKTTKDVDNAITLTAPDNLSWTWYRVYNGNGYDRYNYNVTPVANGNTLTTNVAGVYYAQSGSTRTNTFTYETCVYYPMVSSSGLTNDPFQNGYNGFTSSYSKSLNYTNATPLAMATKAAALAEPEEEEINIPKFDIYASSVSSFNIEFDNTVEMTETNPKFKVILEINGETKTYDVDSRVMSFDYDFTKDVKVKVQSVSNADKNSEQTFTKDSLRQTVSLNGGNYYYIKDDGVHNSGATIDGEYLHIFRNQVLTKDGRIYSLDSNSEIPHTFNNGERIAQTAIYTGTVNNVSYNYYRTFMYSNAVSSSIMIEKNGATVSIDGGTKRLGTGFVMDVLQTEGTESKKQVTSFLQENGTLNISNTMTMPPKEFSNNGIVELADNYSSTSTYMIFKYSNGSVAVVNYATGEFVDKSSDYTQTSTQALFSYAKAYFADFLSMLSYEPTSYTTQMSTAQMEKELLSIPESDMINVYKMTDDNYGESSQTNLGKSEENTSDVTEENTRDVTEENQSDASDEQTIEDETSSSEESTSSDSVTISRDYVPVYNPKTNSYDIYTKEVVLSDKPLDKVKSENEKVVEAAQKGYNFSTNNGIIEAKEEMTKSHYYAIGVTSLIVIGIVVLWLTLRNKFDIFKKNS